MLEIGKQLKRCTNSSGDPTYKPLHFRNRRETSKADSIPIKAAMSLQNNFPKARNYYFWAIFMCYLIERDTASSDNDRKLFGTLAYRMISKAAGSVPTDPVCDSSALTL